ncbi:TPA: thioredoxin family protein [Candidatus Bathyarchaeota archaeon]|nr:thioredoxin family protein [Candidatus Bathyarchaeota archaeon]HIJ08135.1 thioredoxin family protein [Candidatus Bathyarchaeota archaeon]
MKRIDSKHELEKILCMNKKVLALFFSSWCPFCQNFLPSFNRGLEKNSFDEVLHVMVDDYDSSLWEEYSIESVPTVVLFEQGNLSKRLDGKLGCGLNEKQFLEWLQGL